MEACRRDNVGLFNEVMDGMQDQPADKTANFLNGITDVMGNSLLHICANYGSCIIHPLGNPLFLLLANKSLINNADDLMDQLLSVEHLECDPLTPREKETPIHCAVRYAVERNAELGTAMAKMLVEAGGDPRTRDRSGHTPAQICDPRLEDLRAWLVGQEYILREGLSEQANQADENEDATGSASD